MSKQSGKNKDGSSAYIKHVYPDVSVDLTKHNVNVSRLRNYVYASGITMTVRTLDEKKARLEPSLHRFNNLMYMLNHPRKFEAYLK